ncbi:MAG TPA: glycine zipper 2TM domain-containing protein [Ramlibacter sp.]|nr:glycine zipper 2TM domain-containing protein [Ramlibacter sp.]
MNKSAVFCAIGLCAAAAAQAQAPGPEYGRVLSSTPIFQQVAVPRQVCSQQPVAVQQPSSGGGALVGAIIGGVLGNAIGHGGGRAAATALGAVGGAVVGNNVEGSGAQVQAMQQCTTQTFYENRAVAYHVTYEYAGRQYTVQMPQDPGPTVRLQITPVGAGTMSPDSYGATPPPAEPMMVAPPQPQVVATPAYVAPAYVAPAYYYPRPYYYPPIGISLNLGYSRGHRHGHWR